MIKLCNIYIIASTFYSGRKAFVAKNKYNAIWDEPVTDNTEKAAGDNGSENSVLFDDAGNDTMGRESQKAPLLEASFEETVEEFDLSEIKPSYTGKKARIINGMFVVRMILLIACASAFMYCVYSIADRVIKSIENKSIIEDLIERTNQQSVVPRVPKNNTLPKALSLYDALGVTEEDPTYTEVDTAGKYDAFLSTLMDLKKTNSDIYGWIRCKGGMLGIDYPIVKAKDNSYYLYRNFRKEDSPSGSIFADFRNSFTHSDNYNTVFYGHCMTDGSMFRSVKDWFDSPTRNTTANQITIEIITPDAVYVYEIFATYRSEGADFITVSFANPGKYVEFLKSLQKKSVLKRNIPFDANSRIITLSTCTNVSYKPDERYVVHGILTKIIKYG